MDMDTIGTTALADSGTFIFQIENMLFFILILINDSFYFNNILNGAIKEPLCLLETFLAVAKRGGNAEFLMNT